MSSHPQDPDLDFLQEIGEGPIATVYRALDRSTNREVAVKVLHSERLADAQSATQLVDAMNLLSILEHPNLIRVTYQDAKQHRIVMEKMKCGLDTRIKKESVSPDRAIGILIQALKGLQCLHNNQHLHAALKPSNLLVDDRGNVKLSDPQGVKIGEPLPPRCQTHRYLAPEVISPSSGPIGPALDLYCLGFTTLELLKGPGFDEILGCESTQNPTQRWLQIHKLPLEKIPGIADIFSQLPPHLARVLARLTRREVGRRYTDAAQVIDEIESGNSFSEIGTSTRKPTETVPDLPPKQPSHRARWAGLISVAVCFGILLGLLVYFNSRPHSQARSHDFRTEAPPPESPLDRELTIDLSSNPTGATVLVDKVELGVTPLRVQLRAGRHRVELRKQGFANLIKDIFVSGEQDLEQTFDLEMPVTIRTIPTKAAIEVMKPFAQNVKTPTILLKPGRYTLRISHPEYQPQTIKLRVGEDQNPPAVVRLNPLPSQSYAVLAGTRQGWEKLSTSPYVHNDLNLLARSLQVAGYPSKNISLFTSVWGKRDAQRIPSAERIRNALSKLSKLHARDRALIVLSGHIARLSDPNEIYFFPENAKPERPDSLLSLNEILNSLKACPAREKLLILDNGFTPLRNAKPLPPGVKLADLSKVEIPTNLPVLLGTGQHLRYPHAQARNGALLYFVERGFSGAADVNQDGEVTVKELSEYVLSKVPEHTAKAIHSAQRPLLLGATSSSFVLTRPEKSLTLLQRARAQVRKNEIAKATQNLHQAISLKSNLIEAYLQQSLLLYQQKDFKGMIELCNKISKLDPTSATAYHRKGDAYLALGNWTEARKAYSWSLRLDPDYPESWSQRGLTYQKEKNLNRAIADFTEAIERSPVPIPQRYERRGVALFALKQYEKVIPDLTEAIRLKPDAFRLHLRAQAYYSLQKYDNALADCTEALKLDQKQPEIWFTRGVIHRELGNQTEAIDDFSEAIKLRSTFARAYFNRSLSYKSLSREVEAKADLERFAELQKSKPETKED